MYTFYQQGAIKKTPTARTRYRSATTTQKLPSQSVDELDYRRNRRREPQASGDRLLRGSSALPSKYTLPDKNPVRLKQLSSQNGLSTSPRSDYLQAPRRREPFKTRLETRSGTQDRVQSYYNEKRGESSVFAPKDAAERLGSFSRALETRKSREKSQAEVSSDKPRLSSRERRRSRTLSPSEVKVLNQKINQEKLKTTEKKKSYSGVKTEEFEVSVIFCKKIIV